MENRLTFSHIGKNKKPTMVDISHKSETSRSAIAYCKVWLPAEVIYHFKDGDIQSAKGPVFHTAITAGTMAIKKTDQLIPFCHNINIEACNIDIEMVRGKVAIRCQVKTSGKTGAEIEALIGAQIAATTIYDMCKSVSHDIMIGNCRLLEKTGGKSDYNC